MTQLESKIRDYEAGAMDAPPKLLYQDLVDTGLLRHPSERYQKRYQRIDRALLEAGMIISARGEEVLEGRAFRLVESWKREGAVRPRQLAISSRRLLQMLALLSPFQSKRLSPVRTTFELEKEDES